MMLHRAVLGLALVLSVATACDRQAEVPAADAAKPAVEGAAPAGASGPVAAGANEALDSAQPAKAPSPTSPSLKVPLVDGGEYDLATRRGKWVVVNFWATWCGPCLKEMPELSALDQAREHIEVIGLAYEEIEVDVMRDFLKQRPVAYPVAIIDTYNPPADFDTPRGLPMTYLIGPDGKVVEKVLGPVTAHSIEAAIEKAGGPKPGPAVTPAS